MSAAPKPARFDNLGEILKHLGVAADRVRAYPPPGKATEKDVIAIHQRTGRLYELVDGVLVEKIMSFPESALTCDLIKLLGYYLDRNPLGFLTGPDGAVRLMPGLVRIPDISFISWDQLPERKRPTDAIAGLAPDLAVEVLSKGNTKGEMDRKVREYLPTCGVRLTVWLVSAPDPRRHRARLHLHPRSVSTTLAEGETLDGSDVLPGLALPVRQVFAEVPIGTKARGGRPKGRKSRRKRE